MRTRSPIHIAGVLVFVFVVVLAGASAHLIWGSNSEAVDGAELARLIAEKQQELSSFSESSLAAAGAEDGHMSELFVDSAPEGALVLLDSDTLGVTPLKGRAVKAGVYVLSIQKERYAPHDTVVFIEPDAPAPKLFVALHFVPAASRETRSVVSDRQTQTGRPGSATSPTTDRRRQNASQAATPAFQESEAIRASREGVNPPTTERRAAQEEASQSTSENRGTAALGKLTVLVRPWGSIYVDGALMRLNTDVQYTTSLSVGRHVIRAEHPALGAREYVVEIRSDQPQHVVLNLLDSEKE